MLTLAEKKEKATLARTYHVTKRSLHIYGKKRRIFAIVLFLFSAIYTIANKFIFTPKGARFIDFANLFTPENIMLLATLINLIVLLVINFWGNSIYSLNHYVMFRRLRFISSLCKVVIFVSAITAGITSLNAMTQNQFGVNLGTYLYGKMTHVINGSILTPDGKFDITVLLKYISLAIAIITIIPVLWFFLSNYFKMFLFFMVLGSAAAFALPFVLYFLSRSFYEYIPDENNEKYVYKKVWRLPIKGWHIFLLFLGEAIFVALVVLIIINIITGTVKN